MNVPPVTPAAAAMMWPWLFSRGVIAAIYGVMISFWPTAGETAMHVSTGLYMIATGALALRVAFISGDRRIFGAAVPFALAGAIVMIVPSRPSFTIIVAVAFTLYGLMEATAGWLGRRRSTAARDAIVTGLVTAASGVVLPMVQDLGPHAMLGVLGGGAIVTAVVLLIGSLTVRHDAATSSQVA